MSVYEPNEPWWTFGSSHSVSVCVCVCVFHNVLEHYRSFPTLLTVDVISVGSARASANIPLSLQTHRCSTNGTWNGQLKARNCLFHQLPLLRDQLGNNLISVAGKIQIEDTKGYISVCLSKCIWSTSFFLRNTPFVRSFPLLLRCKLCEGAHAWLRRTKFTHEIAFQHTQLHLHVY